MKVVKVEADAVTILDNDGGARVALSVLPPDLQRRFNYDPTEAKIAADKRLADQKLADDQNALDSKQQAALAAKAPKPPLTFEEKVRLGKAQRIQAFQEAIQKEQAFIERLRLDAAINSNDPKNVSRDQQNILNAQKRIADDQAKIENFQ